MNSKLTPQLKKKILKDLEKGKSAVQIAKDEGISKRLIYKWIDQSEIDVARLKYTYRNLPDYQKELLRQGLFG